MFLILGPIGPMGEKGRKGGSGQKGDIGPQVRYQISFSHALGDKLRSMINLKAKHRVIPSNWKI